MTGFKQVKFNYGKIHVSGGHAGKSHPLVSQTVSGPHGEHITFVKMAVTEPWLIMATTGQNKHRASSFGRTSLLDDLRLEIQKLCDGAESSSSAVPMENEEYDPMAEIEHVDQSVQASPKTRGRGQKRTRYYKNHVSKQAATLSTPARCPEEDPHCKETRSIRVYIEDRRQIWLDIADVDWAVRYLYVQNLFKGVPLVPDDSTGPTAKGVPLVPHDSTGPTALD